MSERAPAELGSDTQLAMYTSNERVMRGAWEEAGRLRAEEGRVRDASPAGNEPGRQYPLPDEPPGDD